MKFLPGKTEDRILFVVLAVMMLVLLKEVVR